MPKSTKTTTSRHTQAPRQADTAEQPNLKDDQLMEVILENIHTTPLGQVLKRIAGQGCIRKGKVFNVCRQLHNGTYDLDDRLDAVIDKVLEELTS